MRIVKSNVLSIGHLSETKHFPPLWRRANARNLRLYYPYRQYTNLFIFQFVSLHSTLRLFFNHQKTLTIILSSQKLQRLLAAEQHAQNPLFSSDRSPSPGRRGIDVPFGAPGYREGRDRLRDDPYFKDPLYRLGPPLKRSPYSPARDVYKKLDDHLRPDSYSRPPMDDIPPKRIKPDYDFPPDSRETPHIRPVGTTIDCEVIIINKQQRYVWNI